MNRYEKARVELEHYFAAYIDDLQRPVESQNIFTWALNGATLRLRSVEAAEAHDLAARIWRGSPCPLLGIDQLRKASLACVDIFETLGAEWPDGETFDGGKV